MKYKTQKSLFAYLLALLLTACRPPSSPPTASQLNPSADLDVASPLQRTGDEIVVCGHYFHTGTPVILWTDPGGYDAYRVERRFAPYDQSDWQHSESILESPNRYGLRKHNLTPDQIEQVRGGAWPLELLQSKVDQFVLHYDVDALSRNCFRTLHDSRTLSVHFMLDIDGTIYQTLDCKERAWQATKANDRSVGIEIANIGAYATSQSIAPLEEWYGKDPFGRTRITIPARFKDGGVHTPDFVGYPFFPKLVKGQIQGKTYRQYDFTPEQYEALSHLTATLCTVFPKIKCDYPKDENGELITHALSNEQYNSYHGILGHYHVQLDKQDPGPAFQWDLMINHARLLMFPQK